MEPRAKRSGVRIAGTLAALALGAACRFGPEPAPLPPLPPPPSAEQPTAVPPCERIARIEVRKSERRLRAYCERGGVVELPVALGRERGGPKRSAGDMRTPEGRYRISGPATASRFHLFLPIDYPSVADAEAARAEARLSESAYRRIVTAHERGEPPPEDTPLGGALGFHGEGRRWRGDSEHLDWTLGCIALRDDHVAFLAARSSVGTPVEILP